MQVEQAIFTSVQSGRVRGYQLAARSDGLDERVAQDLVRWGPSHSALCSGELQADSYNLHPVANDYLALSRTFYGGPEYSSRGGMQLITRYAILEHSQFRDYGDDPIALMQLARGEGLFGLVTSFDTRLPAMTLPTTSPSVHWNPPLKKGIAETVDELLKRLERGERLAVTQCFNPLVLLRHLIRRLPEASRLDLSFTTGLKPTAHRPFRLHFLSGETPEVRRSASALGLTCLSATG